ncbi:hypothetical protein B0H16DRAFT_1773010 [Mycena metata]|uniref:F-box domain-containing protein n=1 Tax=Mycena metata TaxID=1033252 RepID=A0AAD7MUG3_9AGAR|nr:hypothetical protein B0H16DRAFT_1773010 [Mycena metata]
MLQVSPEILLEILEMLAIPLAFQAHEFPDRAALASCSLVCKSWSALSQQMLFQRVSIEDHWTGMLFMRGPTIDRLASFLSTITADTNKSRWLRESVRSIILRLPSSSHIVDLLTHLPNLRELDIVGAACTFSEAELAQLQRSSSGSLRSLRVNTDYTGSITSFGAPAWPAVMKLVSAIPTIRMLDITTNTVQQLTLHVPPLQLQLVSAKISSQRIADAGPFLVSMGHHPLEIFHQTKSLLDADLEGILSTHGGHLRSLSLQGPVSDVHALASCTHLERFECRTVPTEALMAAVPRTITALCVHHPVTPTIQPVNLYGAVPSARVARMANGRQLPKPPVPLIPLRKPLTHLIQQLETLPRLRVFTWVGSPMHPEFDALKVRCTTLGIEFRVRATNSVSPELDRGLASNGFYS